MNVIRLKLNMCILKLSRPHELNKHETATNCAVRPVRHCISSLPCGLCC